MQYPIGKIEQNQRFSFKTIHVRARLFTGFLPDNWWRSDPPRLVATHRDRWRQAATKKYQPEDETTWPDYPRWIEDNANFVADQRRPKELLRRLPEYAGRYRPAEYTYFLQNFPGLFHTLIVQKIFRGIEDDLQGFEIDQETFVLKIRINEHLHSCALVIEIGVGGFD